MSKALPVYVKHARHRREDGGVYYKELAVVIPFVDSSFTYKGEHHSLWEATPEGLAAAIRTAKAAVRKAERDGWELVAVGIGNEDEVLQLDPALRRARPRGGQSWSGQGMELRTHLAEGGHWAEEPSLGDELRIVLRKSDWTLLRSPPGWVREEL